MECSFLWLKRTVKFRVEFCCFFLYYEHINCYKGAKCKMRKRVFSLLVLVIALFFVKTESMEAANEKSDDIVILYTNDIHTYIDGPLSYDVLAGIKDKLLTTYHYVLLVDAGDHIQGTAYGSMDDGASIIQLMNETGYDVATLGNHEFDYGMLGCLKAVEDADFPYISANFYEEKDGVRTGNVLDSYVTFQCGDEVIAFVGITTPETFTKSTPAYFQDENGNYIYGIAGGEDGKALYEDVQKAIDDAKASGATKVIALGHLGSEGEANPWSSKATIANVSGLDAFIDGHSHTIMKGMNVAAKDGNEIVLTQTGEYFDRIGIMVIDSETGDIVTDFIECNELLADETETVIGYELVSELYSDKEYISNAQVKEQKENWIQEIDTKLDVKIGSVSVTYDNYDEEGNRLVRMQETNTGDFCADALYYLFDNMDLEVDVAIMNGGGIRNKAVTGDISYKTCKEIHTFGNVACLQIVSGQQILDALEWGARTTGEAECGGFLQVSGLTYKIDTMTPDTTGKDDKGIWTNGPSGEYRVYDVKIYNKETNTWDDLIADQSYYMAGYNYTLRDLGDGFCMFDGAVNVVDYVMEDYMVLANYVSAFENGIVDACNSPLMEKYPGFMVDYSTVNGSGRILVTEGKEDGIYLGGLTNDVWFSKYGNIYLSCTVEDFFNELGFSVGDMVEVSFLEQELILPVVCDYTYVDSGNPAIIVHLTETGEPYGNVSLAINMGNFGETYGLGIKKSDDNGSWWWEAATDVTYPVEFNFEMAKAGGYADQIMIRELTFSNLREDYENLTDAQYANFREIDTTGMGDDKLYRTSTPIDSQLNRNTYALKALEDAGVTVIMNLADSEETATGYDGFSESYYAEQKVIYLNLGVDFTSDEFKDGLASGLRFFAGNEGVYAIHCTHGKDRAGFVCALLECLMGATYEEVVTDYMTSFYNYYGVEPESEKYQMIAESNIVKSLCIAFEVEDLKEADLKKEALEYISALGLTDDEINKLQANLGETDQAKGNSFIWVIPAVICVVCVACIICTLCRRKKK